jgi:hypothetical protein
LLKETENDHSNCFVYKLRAIKFLFGLHVPKLIGALFLILLGWLIAWVFSKLTLTSVMFISRMWQKVVRDVAVKGVDEIKASHAAVIGKKAFWVVMLIFCSGNV